MTGRSEQIGALAAALAKAQAEMGDAKKAAINPHFQRKYADLSEVWDACRLPLSKNGLAVIQTTGRADSLLVVTTTLVHASGEWVSSDLAMRPFKDDPQGVGSCLTYGRRYALAAMVGVAPADDDGEAAHGRQAEPSPQIVKAPLPPPGRFESGAPFEVVPMRWDDMCFGLNSRIQGKLTKSQANAIAREIEAASAAGMPIALVNALRAAYDRRMAKAPKEQPPPATVAPGYQPTQAELADLADDGGEGP